MEIRRTANAGILLRMDGVSLLLDGVCRQVNAYLSTPPAEVQSLSQNLPDAVAFTHIHPDHFDPNFVGAYKKAAGKRVFSTAQAERLLPGCVCSDSTFFAGPVRFAAVSTRHMGKTSPDLEHVSFVIQGGKCVWFMGDAAPQQLKLLLDYPKPDVLIVPFPYLATEAALKQIEAFLPCQIVLVHMPTREYDPDGIWEMVAPAIERFGRCLHCPAIGENLTL